VFFVMTSMPVPDLVIEMKPEILFEVDIMLRFGRPCEGTGLNDVVR
jgi:hypothetical protein